MEIDKWFMTEELGKKVLKLLIILFLIIQELRHAMGTEYETADLEGVDGHLYKGRVKKVTSLAHTNEFD